MNIRNNAIKGLGWMGGLKASTRVISYLRIAILARILSPEQFGVYGIAVLILSFLEIITETGINVFFIQGEGKLKEYISTAWLVSIMRGFVMAVIVALTAPLVAHFFNSPEVTRLLYIGSLIPLVRGFINPSIVRFRKDLDFKKEFNYRLVIFATEGVAAVLLALYTKEATSLIWGLLAGTFVEVFISFKYAKPWPRLEFEYKKFKKVISRGKYVTASWLADYLFRNVDDAFVGKVFSADSLGIYQMAYKFGSLPATELTDVFNRVTLPLYAKISDVTEIKKTFKNTLLLIVSLSSLLAIAIYIFAPLIVKIFLGPGWDQVVPVMRILCIFGASRAFGSSFNALFLAKKKQEYVSVISTIGLISLVLLLFPLAKTYSFMGVSYAVVLSSVVMLPMTIYYYFRLFKEK